MRWAGMAQRLTVLARVALAAATVGILLVAGPGAAAAALELANAAMTIAAGAAQLAREIAG